jgi:hypothetical protein
MHLDVARDKHVLVWTGERMDHKVGGFASKMVDAPKIHYLPQG